MQTTATRPDRSLLAILAVILTIVVIAVVVVLTRGGPTELDPASPEGVVQAYTKAVISDDVPTALDHVRSDIRENCERSYHRTLQGFTMTLNSTTITGDTAIVRVTLEESYGGGMYGESRYMTDDRFDLVRENGLWKIESSPWDLMICDNQGEYQ